MIPSDSTSASSGKIIAIVAAVLFGVTTLFVLVFPSVASSRGLGTGGIFGGEEGDGLAPSQATHDPTCRAVGNVVRHDAGGRRGPAWLVVDKTAMFGQAYDAPRPKTTPVVLLVCQLSGTRQDGQRTVVTARWVEDPQGTQWVSYEEAGWDRTGSVEVSWPRRR